MSFNDTQFNSTFNENDAGNVETKAVSFYTPLIYVSILIISLIVFASQYRKKTVQELSELPSMFDESVARDLFFELKQMNELGEAKVHEKVLKAALLNRGAEAIRRTLKLKESEPQITMLYKNGCVGEEYWKRYQNEVKLVDLEFKEAIQEAEQMQPGWPQLFVAVSKEICFNQALKRRFQAILLRKEVYSEQWQLKFDSVGKLIE
ncbi:LANO_0E07778g1_1 [Lachancea nothofagi CBS 11611]|uniref:LANO_0E07778g1_1 n=1 Tax=Lachancea nothofagi CBS 11611 TaxID=1266666 RepID=A0A1G4JV45_9SACH|nr:LANO_0E07778g1_1 [Lachancea nothofagi CBS 11611]